MSGHHQILVIHAPRARSRLNAALISARWVSLGEVPLPLSCAADLLGIQAYVVGVGEHLLERQLSQSDEDEEEPGRAVVAECGRKISSTQFCPASGSP